MDRFLQQGLEILAELARVQGVAGLNRTLASLSLPIFLKHFYSRKSNGPENQMGQVLLHQIIHQRDLTHLASPGKPEGRLTKFGPGLCSRFPWDC
jgi:hypothetical protein